MAKRSYGSGRLFVRCDSGGRESWYGTWWAGGVRVKRRIGLKRSAGRADGLTRVQAERELRCRIETEVVIARAHGRTVGEAGGAYIEHLEFVMERKRTTVADYRGYLRRHLAPFFGERPLDRIDAARVEAFPRAKRTSGLSSKTACNQLNFLHGVFAFAIKRGWASSNRSRSSTGPARRATRIAASASCSASSTRSCARSPTITLAPSNDRCICPPR